MEDILILTYKTLILYLLLMVCIRIMGKRQIGELEVSEFISTLLLSEIAAIPIAERDIPIFNAILPLLTILALEIIVSFITLKSRLLQRLIDGTPTLLMSKGKLLLKNLKKNRITLDEILSELRIQGIPDISQVSYIILELNGQISAFPTSSSNDSTELSHALVIDGKIYEKKLEGVNLDEKAISSLLSKAKICMKEVLLLLVDDSGNYTVMLKNECVCKKLDVNNKSKQKKTEN